MVIIRQELCMMPERLPNLRLTKVLTAIKTAVIQKYDKAFVTGEYVFKTKKLPCVTVVEIRNVPKSDAEDISGNETLTRVEFEIGIYTHGEQKKSDGNALRMLIDTQMSDMGFERTYCEPTTNYD